MSILKIKCGLQLVCSLNFRILFKFFSFLNFRNKKTLRELENESKVDKSSLEANLHEELILIYKSKKNKDQTFKYRRSVIESSNSKFFDLFDQFKFLSDIKNVIAY